MPIEKFVCMRCPDCCVFEDKEEMPLVFYWEKKELEAIAQRRGYELSFDEFLVVDDGTGGFTYIYRWIIRGQCPFLEGVNCTIHEKKPLACRMFPLIVEIPQNRVYLSLRCRWVRKNIEMLKSERLPYIFDELEIAAKVIGMISEFLKIARENGWGIRIKRN